MITETDIKEGARFRTDAGVIFIIDSIEKNNDCTLVRTSMEHGAKGNYRNEIVDLVDFLNEEESEKL